jgi:hypothetical protein
VNPQRTGPSSLDCAAAPLEAEARLSVSVSIRPPAGGFAGEKLDSTRALFQRETRPACVTKLLLTSECRLGDVPSRSPVSGNSERSLYRVLRLAPRGAGRSVDRERAGRNASSVKGPSPDKQSFPWWPSQYQEAKAAPRSARVPSGTVVESVSDSTRQRPDLGTTGVQDRGMYARPAVERERAVRRRTKETRPRSRAGGQGVTSKSTLAILRAAVRCAHSSDEVGQRPWSEGAHG